MYQPTMMEPSEGGPSDRIVFGREETEHVGPDDNGDDKDDDDDDDDSSDESDVNLGDQKVVGGTIRTPPALCLLDGFLMEDSGGVAGRVTVPILRLPVTVGRAHTAPVGVDQEQNYFVGLGGGTDNAAKAVSRHHIRIDYRVALSMGKCGFLRSKADGSGEESFPTPSPPEYNVCMDDPVSVADIIHITPNGHDEHDTNGSSKSTLPDTGFFTLTVVGRNRVLVQGHRIESGQTVHLVSGSPIRIANFCFYFLTPDLTSTVPRTMSIQEDGSASLSPSSNLGPAPAAVISGTTTVPLKKRKLSVSTAVPAVAGSGAGPTSMGKPSLISEIEALSTVELLQQMTNAVEEQVWDRRHQLIGSTISCRAVLVAARDPHLYAVAMAHEGQLSRTEVMDWIAASPMFRTWVEQMLSKMEAKSYQASITKALIKAGFTRTASTGRYIKWHLPESLQNAFPPSYNDDHHSSMGEDDNDENNDNTRETFNLQGSGANDREQSHAYEDDDDEEEEQGEAGHENSELPDEQDDDDDDENDNVENHHMTTHSERDDTDNRRSSWSDEHYF